MPAPKGNQFWKMRSTHGRDKLFASPELLWGAACEYFEWVDENPLIEVDYVGSHAVECERKHPRPYTIHAFLLYIDAHVGYWSEFKRNNTDKDFSVVIHRVEQTIYNQKFEGAAAGLFNANIISRDLGLADKQEQKQDTTISGAVTVEIKNSGVKLAGRESDVEAGR